MASMARTYPGDAGHRPSAPTGAADVSGGRPPRHSVQTGERQWPSGAQVWNWAESVVLSGYGPPAYEFLRPADRSDAQTSHLSPGSAVTQHKASATRAGSTAR